LRLRNLSPNPLKRSLRVAHPASKTAALPAMVTRLAARVTAV